MKTYNKPEIKVFDIQMSLSLLAGSEIMFSEEVITTPENQLVPGLPFVLWE